MKTIHTDLAPAAIGPYSQGILAGRTLYVSGQLPLAGGELLTQAGEAASASLHNVLAIVEAGGGTRQSIAKCVVFLTDMKDFAAMNEAYARFFGDHKPARSCIQVGGLPKGAVLEIEAVAVLD